MAGKGDKLPSDVGPDDADIARFLENVARAPAAHAGRGQGRLIFAMDATASREPTWDMACDIQARMFEETAKLGTLRVQLAYYRGFGEFKAGPFEADSAALLRRMTSVRCRGGRTQIDRVLRHAIDETGREKVNALVLVGDAFEEDLDAVCHTAGELGLLGVPAFLFHEGADMLAGQAFKEIARLTGGAYCRFDMGSARALRELLAAVAVYAVGGARALEDYHRRAGRTVLQIAGPSGR